MWLFFSLSLSQNLNSCVYMQLFHSGEKGWRCTLKTFWLGFSWSIKSIPYRHRLKVWRFNPRERKLWFSPFIHELCSWLTLLSVSNYTEQRRDFLIFFFYFDLQLNKICLFYFWLKNDEPAPTPVSPQSCWFSPLLRNLFQTMSAESDFSGKRSLPRPSGVLSAVYFVNYKF